MTSVAVKEGVFRAHAQTDSRGRRKQRGEFLPAGTVSPELPSTRRPISGDTACVVPAFSTAPASESNAPAELHVQVEDNGSEGITLHVSGTLDLSTVLPFRDSVFTAIGNRPPLLVLDITRLNQVDVAGISALVTTGRVARLMNVPFSVSPSPSLKSLLQETGLYRTVSLTGAS